MLWLSDQFGIWLPLGMWVCQKVSNNILQYSYKLCLSMPVYSVMLFQMVYSNYLSNCVTFYYRFITNLLFWGDFIWGHLVLNVCSCKIYNLKLIIISTCTLKCLKLKTSCCIYSQNSSKSKRPIKILWNIHIWINRGEQEHCQPMQYYTPSNVFKWSLPPTYIKFIILTTITVMLVYSIELN